MGIPIPQTLVILAFPSHITLAIWVRVTWDAHITCFGNGDAQNEGITAILEDDWGRGCCTCEQDTEKPYRGQQFCQNELKGHFGPTNQRWSQIFRLGGTLMESAPSCGPRIWVNAMVGLLKKPLFNWEFIESVHSVGSQEQGSRRYFADVTIGVKITSGTRL